MSEITEYQEVAAILCMDIDVIAKVATDPKWSAGELRELIARLKIKKDTAVNDPVVREERFNDTSSGFEIAARA